MILFSVRRLFGVISVVLATTASVPAQSGSGFPMVGIASGQSARVNALNAAAPDPSNPTSQPQPGTAASLDLSWGELPAGGLRTEVRGAPLRLLGRESARGNPAAIGLWQSFTQPGSLRQPQRPEWFCPDYHANSTWFDRTRTVSANRRIHTK